MKRGKWDKFNWGREEPEMERGGVGVGGGRVWLGTLNRKCVFVRVCVCMRRKCTCDTEQYWQVGLMPLRKPSEFNLIDPHRRVGNVASGPCPESPHTRTCAHTHTQNHRCTHPHSHECKILKVTAFITCNTNATYKQYKWFNVELYSNVFISSTAKFHKCLLDNKTLPLTIQTWTHAWKSAEYSHFLLVVS